MLKAKMTDQKIFELESQHAVDHNKKMLDWLETGEHYDCTFSAGPSHALKYWRCHRFHMATASPVLETMLYGHFEESKKGIDDKIHLHDVTPETFEAVIRFIYGKDTSGLRESLSKTMNVLVFAVKWEIALLGQVAATLCLNFDLSAEDLLALHALFSTHFLYKEASQILQIICDRGSEVLQSLAIAHEDTVVAIFEVESINVFSEKDFFDGLVKWGAAKVEEEIISNDEADEDLNANIKAYIEHWLGKVRFKNFTTQDMAHLCRKSVLTEAERLAIFSSVQLQKELPDELKSFDISSPWRGRFKPPSKIIPLKWSKCSRGISVSRSTIKTSLVISDQNIYLLSVGVNSLCNLNQGRAMHLVLELLEGETVLSKQEFQTVKNEMSISNINNSMVRLVNPILLQSGKHYSLAITHLKSKGAHAVNVLSGHPCISFKGSILWCSGESDICALEVALPL